MTLNDKDREQQTEAENMICNQILEDFKSCLYQIKNKYENNGTPLPIIRDGVDGCRQLCEVYINFLERKITGKTDYPNWLSSDEKECGK